MKAGRWVAAATSIARDEAAEEAAAAAAVEAAAAAAESAAAMEAFAAWAMEALALDRPPSSPRPAVLALPILACVANTRASIRPINRLALSARAASMRKVSTWTPAFSTGEAALATYASPPHRRTCTPSRAVTASRPFGGAVVGAGVGVGGAAAAALAGTEPGMAARWSDPQPPRPPLTAIRRGSTQLHIKEASGIINSVRISRSSRAAFGSGSAAAAAAAAAVATIDISTSSCSRASPRRGRDKVSDARAPW